MFDVFSSGGYIAENLLTATTNWWSMIVGSQTGQLGPYNVWVSQLAKYQLWNRYFYGLVFNDKIANGEARNDADAPLMQPVGMNVSKMLCLAMADALFGEWRRHVIGFSVTPDDNEEVPEEKIKVVEKWLNQLFYRDNRSDTLLWEFALDQQHYGGSFCRVKPTLSPLNKGGVLFERVEPPNAYPIWSPDDYNDLMELYVAMRIPLYVAQQMYNLGPDFAGASSSRSQIDTNPSVVRVEHWTKTHYETYINGVKLTDAKYSNAHNFGEVPFVYTPRFRSGGTGFFGEALIDDVWRISDEINMRVADIGEALNYNTHPIRYGYNLPADFSTAKYQFDPSEVWDFGRVISDAKPELHLLESKHPVPLESFKHIKFLYDWARTSVSAPPIAFGEDEGSQRSGQTLVIRLWPMLRSVVRSRAYNADAILKMIRLAFNLCVARKPKGVDPDLYEIFPRVQISCVWSPIIPRDRQAIVDEMVKRMASVPRLGSLRTALTEFDDINDIAAEMKLIEEEMEKFQPAPSNLQNNNQQKGPPASSIGAE